MSFNRLLYPLRLNADISLCYLRAVVLQEPLDQGNVIAIVFVDFCRVPFSETVCADSLIEYWLLPLSESD